MRILGIDPGLATIGLGLLEGEGADRMHVRDWLTIKTSSTLPLAERLGEIAENLRSYLREAAPDLVVVERLFFARNERSAMDVAHARGVILSATARQGRPILEPTPLQLKLAITGNGRATKEEMQRMLVHLLHLKEMPRPDDAADAIALAFYGALHQNTVLSVG